ncbi:hypothetical protein BC830DRAFT_1157275 [Chytriomyces sp. MP71]|nr:hypothetical protein BC830DRAFT_1157275 [Chytriomyces sp. MP71]
MNELDLIPISNLSASSWDTSSPACPADRCGPQQVSSFTRSLPGNASFWQSALDATCPDQWIQATFPTEHIVQNFSIRYGSLGRPAPAKSQNASIPFTLFMNPDTLASFPATQLARCTLVGRLDACSLQYPTVTHGARFAWTFDRGPVCQVTVEEVIVLGVPSFRTTGGTDTRSQEVSVSDGSGVTKGTIAGIAVGSLAVLLVVAALVVRRRNLAMRKEVAGPVPELHFVELDELE